MFETAEISQSRKLQKMEPHCIGIQRDFQRQTAELGVYWLEPLIFYLCCGLLKAASSN